MLKSKVASALSFMAMLAGVSSPARAVVTLELQPVTQTVYAGRDFEIELYAVANPSEPVGVVAAILDWDPNDVELKFNHDDGAYSWDIWKFMSGGLNGNCVDGVCDGWGDGKALSFTAVTSCGTGTTATPQGQLLTTFVFNAAGNTGATPIQILASYDDGQTVYQTEVYDAPPGCGGVSVGGPPGPAVNVTVLACGDVNDCDDQNACTDDACDTGVCSYTNNYADTLFCCDPGTRDLTPIDDDDDCTDDECDPATGQVSHPMKDNGTACGDQSDVRCTDPDTCLGGVCMPNHSPDGWACDNYCTLGADMCQGGVCTGGGDDPCTDPALPYCQERDSTSTSCPNGDVDCTLQDYACTDDTTGLPCPGGGPDCVCTRPYTCVECASSADCSNSGDCYSWLCNPSGGCMQFVDHAFCQNGLYCDGEEVCVLQPTPHCDPDPLPPCEGVACREETCCVGEICGEEVCQCVACLDDTDCDDGDLCTEGEACDLVTFTCALKCTEPPYEDCVSDADCTGDTNVCAPRRPVDCSYLDDDCNDGVCISPDGLCEAQVIDWKIGVPGICEDGADCTFDDTCTAQGACVGQPPTLDGAVDLQWDPVEVDTTITVALNDTVYIDLYAVTDVGRCEFSRSPCSVSSQDCRNVCDDGYTECDVAGDCPGGFCNTTQVCQEGHEIITIQTILRWYPTVLQLVGNQDPCTGTTELCRTCADGAVLRCTGDQQQSCTIDDDCLGGTNYCVPYCMCEYDADCPGGLACFCPEGTPCTGFAGICITGEYDWASSYFPSGGGDPDGINDTWTDGDALYSATTQFMPAGLKTPLTSADPLLTTEFEFTAVGLSAGSVVEIDPCVAGTETWVLGDGAGNQITGNLGTITVQVVECILDGDCPDDFNACTVDQCIAGVCQYTPISPDCVPCEWVGDCDDGIDCIGESCVGGICEYADICADDGQICNGDEYCDQQLNSCEHTGDPCPGFCVPGVGCPCLEPLIESAGARYIAISPQPETGEMPMSFLVKSPDWPCLSKYVGGFLECGETGNPCQTTADCNSCTGPLGGPCLADEDCKTCQDAFQNPCETDADCDQNQGILCELTETCDDTGIDCVPHLPLDTIDLNDDGLADGIVASLVDDPADAASMTPSQWSAGVSRCSVSLVDCTDDSDCDVGACSISQSSCSISTQTCSNVCAIGLWECTDNSHCTLPGDTCSVPQTCEPFETCDPGRVYVTAEDILPSTYVREPPSVIPVTYEVSADCGGISTPAQATMRAWGDVNDSQVVNMTDVQHGIKAFEATYDIDIPARTKVSADLVGSGTTPCVPNRIANMTDIQRLVLIFEGQTYDDMGCTVPCP